MDYTPLYSHKDLLKINLICVCVCSYFCATLICPLLWSISAARKNTKIFSGQIFGHLSVAFSGLSVMSCIINKLDYSYTIEITSNTAIFSQLMSSAIIKASVLVFSC